jgi:hypothetical protein
MKKFLLQEPSNAAWVKVQEQRRVANDQVLQDIKLLRAAKYPELQLASLMPTQLAPPPGLLVMARQRALMRIVMQELIKYFASRASAMGQLEPVQSDPLHPPERQTAQHHKTHTWQEKALAIFFYLHPQLGNSSVGHTCTVFGMNAETFPNWLRQPRYYGRWVPFVRDCTYADVARVLPATVRHAYDNVDLTDTVTIPARVLKHVAASSTTFVCSVGVESWQKKRKAASQDSSLVYLTTKVKRVGAGRKLLYIDESNFIMTEVATAWETGNPMTRAACFHCLLVKYGPDTDRPWTKAMAIDSGTISPNLSQWLSRTLARSGYSVRKESISQSVPINWFELALEATEAIRVLMDKAGVSKLVNMDEMFLNFYPKETHLIVPTGTKRVGANRKEDEKKGCTIAVSCEMFESQVMAPFVVMDGKPHGYLSKKYNEWDGASSIHFKRSTGWTARRPRSTWTGSACATPKTVSA